jgi:hypothetical protein
LLLADENSGTATVLGFCNRLELSYRLR